MTIAARSTQLLGLHGFANAGTPELIKKIDLAAPADRQYVLRLAIRAEGGDYQIPAELEWVRPMFEAALEHQAAIGADHPFCYITVRHGLVESETDDEWHVDGFSMKLPHVPEQNYVWCSQAGTEYAPMKVAFPADFNPLRHNINHFLADHVDEATVRPCEDRAIHCMDPYLLHRRPSQTAGTWRTFVRVSFVPIEINDVNNTQNPLLPRDYTADGVAFRNKLETYQADELPLAA